MRIVCFVLSFLFLSSSFIKALEPVVYLTSKEDVSSKFIEKIKKETVSIRMVCHRLSDPAVVQSLVEAHARNVSVELIVDSVSLTKNTPLKKLLEEGILVFVWQSDRVPKKKGETLKRLKHSFCVFNQEKCWLGSYSFPLKRRYHPFESAVSFESQDVAKKLLNEFETIKKEYSISLSSFLKQREVRE